MTADPSIRELLPPDTHLAFRAIASLRGLTDVTRFVERVDQEQRPLGYRLVGSFEANGTAPVAVAGFRLVCNLAVGNYLQLDDLVTLPGARRHGHARALLRFLASEVERSGLRGVHVDVDRERIPPELWRRGPGMIGPYIEPGAWFSTRMLFGRFGFKETGDHLALTIPTAAGSPMPPA